MPVSGRKERNLWELFKTEKNRIFPDLGRLQRLWDWTAGQHSSMQRHLDSWKRCQSTTEEHAENEVKMVASKSNTELLRPVSTKIQRLHKFVSATTTIEKEALDMTVANYSFATKLNMPLSKQWWVSKVRPIYESPERRGLRDELQESVYLECVDRANSKLHGKYVTISLDGWTNVNNDA